MSDLACPDLSRDPDCPTRCPGCGASHPHDAVYCPYCGSGLDRAPALPSSVASAALCGVDAHSRAERARAALAPYELATLEQARAVMPPRQYLAIVSQVDADAGDGNAPAAGTHSLLIRAAMAVRHAPVTLLLLAAIWIVFAVESGQPGGSESIFTLVRLGAVSSDTLQSGAVWRLVASCFLHIGILHIGGNAIALLWLGLLAERLYGSLRYLAIYLAAGIGGAVLTVLVAGSVISAGASGAIWGLMGALLVGSWRNPDVPGRLTGTELRQSIVAFIIANAIFSFAAGVSLSAHAGGCAIGAAMGALVPFAGAAESRIKALVRRGAAWAIIAGAAGLMVTAAF